jgi:hypothetical protein
VAWYISRVENEALAGVRTEATSLPAEEVIRLSLRPPLGDLVIGPLAGREKDEEAVRLDVTAAGPSDRIARRTSNGHRDYRLPIVLSTDNSITERRHANPNQSMRG